MNINWFQDPNNVTYAQEGEVLPRLARELGISDLAGQVAAFRAAPTAAAGMIIS